MLPPNDSAIAASGSLRRFAQRGEIHPGDHSQLFHYVCFITGYGCIFLCSFILHFVRRKVRS